jgi:hypothetical protein
MPPQVHRTQRLVSFKSDPTLWSHNCLSSSLVPRGRGTFLLSVAAGCSQEYCSYCLDPGIVVAYIRDKPVRSCHIEADQPGSRREVTRQKPVGAPLQVTPWHFLFVALIGLCLLVGSGPQKRFVQVKSLQFLGEVSYGLYLYHLLIFALFDHFVKNSGISSTIDHIFMLLARFLIVSAIAIPASLISRRLFEDRFLNLKRRLAP